MTAGRPVAERHKLAWQAAVVALGVIVAFAVFGRSILSYLGVELPSLQAAGGLLLLLVALELLTGRSAEPTELERARANVAFVPLGTPLLAGPGAIVATMLFVQRIGSVGGGVAFGAAIVEVVVVVWLGVLICGVIFRLVQGRCGALIA